jgi:hypothetical protein
MNNTAEAWKKPASAVVFFRDVRGVPLVLLGVDPIPS